MNYSYTDELTDIVANSSTFLDDLEIDPNEGEYIIVQPYKDGNAIIVKVVEEADGRTVKAEVSNSVVVLPAKDGVLDVFA